MSLSLYRLATTVLEPLAPLLLHSRARKGKEDPARLSERLGRAGRGRPEGPLVWIHGASVGESLSALPLIELILKRRPDVSVLATSGTVASAQLMAQRLPAGAVHQYAPIDAPAAVGRFLDHWRPDLGVLVESELWPNLVLQAKARGARLALVSARITEHTAEGWAKRPASARRLLSAFDLMAPQDEASAERLVRLGGRDDLRVNLKLTGRPLDYNRAEFDRLSEAVGDRAVVLGASTHPGEEVLIAGAARAADPSALIVIAPRHPVRAEAVADELEGQGLNVARRSRGEALAPDTQVYLADTLGELGLFFALADVVVLGGGFFGGVGGHNPLEPARQAKAVIAGPDMANWRAIFEGMAAADAVRLADRDQLGAALAAWLADPEAARATGRRAEAYATSADADLTRLWARLESLLPEARIPEKGP
ncbi:3-deoxy-D-manno-octulosonic acid transferase [Brevundimonas sp. 2R-24]|uniref:3-deoxy-D-manno-octulosonic acid transferase n=1 Tax=Peiella sedimenti TaxID=3061083 RepID=A0ABT8SLS2_9CAUL|nr:3-deoxy-D-manno-octulosonic acid transferase [Caulobacteraceae bacterium XZ-24]